jgi:predicted tellurium resistance membrane protein TerC
VELLMNLATDPAAWIALITLIIMEVVLGIDNLVFISIVTNKLPEAQRPLARQIGIGLALVLRLLLLFMIAWIAGLTTPVFDLGFEGPPLEHGGVSFETAFSWRDIILLAGGIFLMWKATTEIHHKVDPEPVDSLFKEGRASLGFVAAITQIILLDAVFSVDSILTAIGMTDDLPIMIIAVLFAMGVMFFSAGPIARFIHNHPSVVMLALSFLLMIGMVLIADGLGVHVPKGYVYAAMGFSMFVEYLNTLSRRRSLSRAEK